VKSFYDAITLMLADILRIQKEWANNFTAVKERETDYTACEDKKEPIKGWGMEESVGLLQ